MASIAGLAGPVLDRLDRMRPWQVFDRPLFVIAPPRSGSTLLLDMLAAHPDLVSWPFEAPDAFEAARPAGHPFVLGHRWPPEYATEELRRRLSRELYLGRLTARRLNGLPNRRVERLALGKVRLLEKTPSNVLRVEVLARIYPDAKFVFLHRDAPGGIASLIEAWESPSQAHASFRHDGRVVRWMMLAPPGWLDMTDASVPERAAFQWRAGVEFPARAFAGLPAERWTRTSYEQLVAAPVSELDRILEFADLAPHPAVHAAADRIGTAGRTSFSAPRADKWRDRAEQIEPLLAPLAEIRTSLGYLSGGTDHG